MCLSLLLPLKPVYTTTIAQVKKGTIYLEWLMYWYIKNRCNSSDVIECIKYMYRKELSFSKPFYDNEQNITKAQSGHFLDCFYTHLPIIPSQLTQELSKLPTQLSLMAATFLLSWFYYLLPHYSYKFCFTS